MAYPKILYTVCCVAEIVGNEEGACPHCKGTQLQSHFYYEADGLGFFDADAFVSGGNLQSYRFDEIYPGTTLTSYPENLKVRINYPVPEGFVHLCLKYNREGGARINVVAADWKTKEKLRPSQISDGLDWSFPIESAIVTASNGDEFDVRDQFKWENGQLAVLPDPQPGAWTIEPKDSELGNMALAARPYLEPDNTLAPGVLLGKFEFHHWERNRLSSWSVGTEHQWSGDGEHGKPIPHTIILGKTIELDNTTYTGLIAYYKWSSLDADGNIHVADTKPGSDELRQPKVVWPILSALFQVWNWVVESVKRVFRRGGGT